MCFFSCTRTVVCLNRKHIVHEARTKEREFMRGFARIVGSGQFFPSTTFATETLVLMNGLVYSDGPKKGQPLSGDWAKRYFGIVTRPLDLVQRDGEWVKLLPEQGGLYGVHMGVLAAREALIAANITGRDIGFVVEASATHDSIGVGDHVGHYIDALDLAPNTDIFPLPVGCGGFLPALKQAEASLRSGFSRHALVILQNCPSAQFASKELRSRYSTTMENIACFLVFSDGAVAFVLTLDEERGFINSFYQTRLGSDYKLIDVKAGGGFRPAEHHTLADHAYFMYADKVQAVFRDICIDNWNIARPWVHAARERYGPADIGEYVFHQASKPALLGALSACPDIPLDKVHFIMETYGNPAVCSGPLVLHHALTRRNHKPGTLLPVMLLGAGNGGTLHGAALYRV